MMEKAIQIEKELCEFFGVDKESIYARNAKRKVSNARHYLWFILHTHFGLSFLDIAKMYNRSRRKVIQYCMEIRFRVNNQREDKDVYDKIKTMITEL